ncbi:MAG: NUDIX domain-containing protein [Anaerolineales bacterium]
MTRLHYGKRIGKQGQLRIGCSAILFDVDRQRVLLTRRADNGEWCLPGGALEAGESVEEACIREFYEETGLEVRPIRLVGVYSNRDVLIEYPDGNRVQMVVLHFEVEAHGGKMRLSPETTEIGFFSLAEIQKMKLIGPHYQRILDSLEVRPTPILRP